LRLEAGGDSAMSGAIRHGRPIAAAGFQEIEIQMHKVIPANWLAVIVLAVAWLAIASVPGAKGAEPVVITFAQNAPGTLPPGFTAALTGRGGAVKWAVVEDATAPGGKALAETSADTTDYRFPLATYDLQATDVDVSIHFKAIAGRVDQAAGIAVRLADADNYYVVRANALENNVRFYRVVRGNRQQLASSDTRVTSNEWHTLTLRAEGDRFTVSLDGRQLFTATDRTFAGGGKVALWTKADSVTHFDKVTITSLP
jgi:hypothetical protein